MKFFEKLKETFDMTRRAREAEAQVDELRDLLELKIYDLAGLERELKEAHKECARLSPVEQQMRCVVAAYARLKVDADVMRQEIKEYRRRLFDKEQGNA